MARDHDRKQNFVVECSSVHYSRLNNIAKNRFALFKRSVIDVIDKMMCFASWFKGIATNSHHNQLRPFSFVPWSASGNRPTAFNMHIFCSLDSFSSHCIIML
jgi:hypothetical protein